MSPRFLVGIRRGAASRGWAIADLTDALRRRRPADGLVFIPIAAIHPARSGRWRWSAPRSHPAARGGQDVGSSVFWLGWSRWASQWASSGLSQLLSAALTAVMNRSMGPKSGTHRPVPDEPPVSHCAG